VIPIPPYSEQRLIVSAIETAFALIDEIEENETSIKQLIKQTKSKVLDLSVRGKLVPQHNDEEPVSALLSRINGRQKSPNPSADIFHYPFKVPNSWIWAKGSECFNPMENKRPTGDIFGYIDINSIDNKKHIIAKLKYLKASEAPSRASRRVNAGDILFSMVRPYLENIAYIDNQFVDCIASTGFYVCKPRPLLFPKYLYYLMLSPYVINGLNTFIKGDNSPSINNDNITSFLYPLPPLQEQFRIVDQIEKIFAQLDKIEEAIKA
jgi:type I restriction enzyme S subunit